MGASNSNLRAFLEAEYERIGGDARDWLGMEEVLQIRVPDLQWGIDLHHLGVLWQLDGDKDGRVSFSDLETFLDACDALSVGRPPYELRSRLQGWCMLQLTEALRREEGPQRVADWACRFLWESRPEERLELAAEEREEGAEGGVDGTPHARGHAARSSTDPVGPSTPPGPLTPESARAARRGERARQGRRWWQREHKGAAQERALEKYVHRGMLDVLHRVLRIEEAQGISAEAFAGLVQAAGEEEGLLPLEDASMDDWAPLSTLRGMMLEVCGSMGRMWAEIAGDA